MENKEINWFKRHGDTFAILGVILGMFYWMNTRMDTKFDRIDQRFAILEKDVAVIKAVLVMHKIMPTELAIKETNE